MIQGGKTSVINIIEKQLLLPRNLLRVIEPFPIHMEPIILQRERLFTSGKHSRQLTISPGVDVPASSFRGQTVQCSEKLQETQEVHLRLHRPLFVKWLVLTHVFSLASSEI